jgi:hypothetical protein
MKSVFKGKGNGQKSRWSESSQGKDREFWMLLRVACSHYLKNMHVLHIFNVLRIKKQSCKFHVAACRKIAHLMK